MQFIVVMVPYEFILPVVREAVAIGMSGLVITTSGFAEAGRSDLQDELLRIASEGNLRLIGPNVDALIDLLLNLSRMIIEKPEIKELDLNPVRVYEKGLLALDARVLRRERRDKGD